MYGIRKVMAKLSALSVFWGQVKFSLDKYITAIQLSLGKYKILLFPHPYQNDMSTHPFI